jgi:hypothetical protein
LGSKETPAKAVSKVARETPRFSASGHSVSTKGRLMRLSGFIAGGGACGKRYAEQSKRDEEGPQQGKTRASKRGCPAFLTDSGHIRGAREKIWIETAPK